MNFLLSASNARNCLMNLDFSKSTKTPSNLRITRGPLCVLKSVSRRFVKAGK